MHLNERHKKKVAGDRTSGSLLVEEGAGAFLMMNQQGPSTGVMKSVCSTVACTTRVTSMLGTPSHIGDAPFLQNTQQ